MEIKIAKKEQDFILSLAPFLLFITHNMFYF